MTIKEKIFIDLTEIVNPKLLYQILEFIALLKRSTTQIKGNREKVLALAGVLSHQDGEEIKSIVDAEFNNIEGEW